jgi:Mn2+/Fe2+ NRAMP family transporter
VVFSTNNAKRGRVRTFFAELGPGLITGAADDDP